MRILTYNWHEPFLCMLARTGGSFDVVEPDLGRGTVRKWDIRARVCPQNMKIITAKESFKKLNEGYYDLVLCHNFKDVKVVAPFSIPIILVFHNKLSTELALGENSVEREKYLADIESLANRVDTMVFVSASKKEDWGFARGTVICPGIDPDDYASYQGDIMKILRVGNLVKERGIMLGYDIQEEICDWFDSTLLGNNPTITSSRPAESWDDLKAEYAGHRLYLSATQSPFEDGYNLAMLEAMATGAPVISWGHSGSPITNEVDGYLSSDITEIRMYISELFEDIDLARQIGANGRETVLEMFGMERFKGAWVNAFDEAIKSHKKGPINSDKRLNRNGMVHETV